MKKTIISMALLTLIGVPGAVAQSGSKGTVGATINGTIPDAPVGHRQPRAGDVPQTSGLPNEKNDLSRIRSPRKTRSSTRRLRASAEGARRARRRGQGKPAKCITLNLDYTALRTRTNWMTTVGAGVWSNALVSE
jgi:hypothetical protein